LADDGEESVFGSGAGVLGLAKTLECEDGTHD
jgi:hypothetical protein